MAVKGTNQWLTNLTRGEETKGEPQKTKAENKSNKSKNGTDMKQQVPKTKLATKLNAGKAVLDSFSKQTSPPPPYHKVPSKMSGVTGGSHGQTPPPAYQSPGSSGIL